MKRTAILLLLSLALHASAQEKSDVWSPDQGNGTYQNPVLFADYSDPDVCAVGEDYYLTASSFGCVPGLPILHSRDLVNWTIVGHALQELEPREVFDKPAHGQGVWAPAIRHHNGRFYIYWGDPDHGIFMVCTQDPAGRWEKPICVVPGKGMIDPCPLWDEDGRCYLVNGWANSRAGFNSVLSVRELSADGTRAIGLPRIVFDGGQENHTTEGPKFYRRDNYYWILCPAGGVEKGWQLAMRARSVYGPYEWKRVMWQGATDVNGPHQGGWVHTAFGEDWFLHFNDRDAYGRVVYLQPVDWSSGWPVMGRQGEPYTSFRKPKSASAAVMNPQENDEFDGPLGLQWQWHGNYNQFWGMPTDSGNYRLYTQVLQGNLWEAPHLLLQKLTAPRFTATAHLRFTAKEEAQWAALLMMGMDYSALAVCREGDHFVLQQRTCKDADQQGAETTENLATLSASDKDTIPYAPAIHLDIYLRLKVADGQCRFAYSTDGKEFRQVGSPFTLRKGKWIGAKMGFVAATPQLIKSRGWADIDWFRVGSERGKIK
ncbi:MAG: glycoside hydrolase 43 family protein [Bacteroidaceae bacterium]|nr:glycoside hydrolase 43 family protein [Bacteroidaceae bacterium]